jgi:predicted aldo/keto reductase-like oxidoreductase
VIDACIETGQYSMALAAYNVINHRYVDKALENAKKKDFGVIAMKAARPVNNGRNNGTKDDPARVEKIQKAVPGELKVPQKAYLWVLRNPNLSATISEMDTLEKMKDNVPVAGQKA